MIVDITRTPLHLRRISRHDGGPRHDGRGKEEAWMDMVGGLGVVGFVPWFSFCFVLDWLALLVIIAMHVMS